MAEVFNLLGQSVMPRVFAKLQSVGLSETMTIKRAATTAGTGGGRIKTGTTDAYTNVPVAVEMRTSRGARFNLTDKLESIADYVLTFPVNDAAGDRYDIDISTDRLVVNARGNEPAKTFRMLIVPDDNGIVFAASCTIEN